MTLRKARADRSIDSCLQLAGVHLSNVREEPGHAEEDPHGGDSQGFSQSLGEQHQEEVEAVCGLPSDW